MDACYFCRTYVLGNVTYDKSVSPTVSSMMSSANSSLRSIRVVLSGSSNTTNSSIFYLRLSRAGNSRKKRDTVNAWKNSDYVYADVALSTISAENYDNIYHTARDFVCDDACNSYETILGEGRMRLPGSAKSSSEFVNTKSHSSSLNDFENLFLERRRDGNKESSQSHSRQARQTTESQQEKYEISCVVVNETSLSTELECDLDDTPAGQYDSRLISGDLGGADTTSQLSISASVSTESLRNGSVHGGTTIGLTGRGFNNGETRVDVGDISCEIVHVSPTEITCQTPAGTGEQQIRIRVGNQVILGPMFHYDLDITPEITSIST